MLVIFLDIDGVLCCGRSFSLSALELFVELVKQTGSKIVLSSTWRLFKDQKLKVSQKLIEYGIDLYDCTGDSSQDRQQEILHWLNQHNKNNEISNWIAIDDIPLERGKYKTQFSGHCVTTNPKQGFSKADFELACELLN